MYDLIKRKHEQTPTPEKQPNKSRMHRKEDQPEDSEEEEDDDDEDDEDEDDDDDDDDDDGEGEEEKDYKGYRLRQRRPIPNRYTAPPLKTSSRGMLVNNLWFISAFYFFIGSASLADHAQVSLV